MIASATQLLHGHHGHPEVKGCADRAVELCYVCACPWPRSQPVVDWMGTNFTGQGLVLAPTSPLICEACVWAMAGKPPHTLRSWCHLFDGRGYVRVNKGDKPAIREWLRGAHEGPWFAAIADSGKKHVLPFSPVNVPGMGGRIRFEDEEVALPRDDGWRILDDATELLTLGATKAEIEPGRYGPRAWSLCPDAIAAFEDAWSGLRHGAWFRLVLWLAQRDEERVQARMAAEQAAKKGRKNAARKERGRSAAHVDDGGSLGAPSRVPEQVRADGGPGALEPPGLSASSRNEDGGGARGVGDDDVPDAAASGDDQLGLPGIA